MATVLLSMFPEEGHHRASFKIARSLQARGHRTLYLATADFRAFVEEQGFEHVALFPDLYPAGTLREERLRIASARGFSARLKASREVAERQREAGRRWTDGTGDRLLAGIAPDLVLSDSFSYMPALLARRAGISHFLLDSLLPHAREGALPPLDRPQGLRPGLGGRLAVERAWAQTLAGNALRRLVRRVLGVDPGQRRLLRDLARHTGLPARQVRARTPFFPMPGLPEIILCPAAFDFPRPPVPDRLFAEASVDLDRREVDFPFDRLDPGRPLVYCSLGSQGYRVRGGAGFFHRVIELFRSRPGWQLALATGSGLDVSELGPLPENVIAVAQAPQLALLRRAGAMITHGGLSSVKECLLLGVPMLVVPLVRDQPGNAARVAHHGLGEVLPLTGASPAALAESLERLLGDESLRGRVAAMQSEFVHHESAQPGLARIRGALGEPPR